MINFKSFNSTVILNTFNLKCKLSTFYFNKLSFVCKETDFFFKLSARKKKYKKSTCYLFSLDNRLILIKNVYWNFFEIFYFLI